jgi:hypothetical protein
VPNISREHYTQVPPIEDQHAVSEFGADRTHEPFGETVRLRATRRNPDHADAHIGEDRIERCCELAVPLPITSSALVIPEGVGPVIPEGVGPVKTSPGGADLSFRFLHQGLGRA